MQAKIFYTGGGHLKTQNQIVDVIADPSNDYWEANKNNLVFLRRDGDKCLFAYCPPGIDSSHIRILNHEIIN